MVLENVCDVYICCSEGCLIWVVKVSEIVVLQLEDCGEFFDLVESKVYCYLIFYIVLDGMEYM